MLVRSQRAFYEKALDYVPDVNELTGERDQPHKNTPPGAAQVMEPFYQQHEQGPQAEEHYENHDQVQNFHDTRDILGTAGRFHDHKTHKQQRPHRQEAFEKIRQSPDPPF